MAGSSLGPTRVNSPNVRLTPLRILAILYPALSIIAQYPLGDFGISWSLERLLMVMLAPFCVLQVMAGDKAASRLIYFTPRLVTFGLALWYVAMLVSFGLNFGHGDIVVLQSYTLKLALGILFAFAVAEENSLRNATRLFALSTFFATFASFYINRTQGSGAIRSAAFVNVDFGNVSLIEGLARAGAVGSLPLMAAWLEAVYARRLWQRAMWYGIMFTLFVASMLALRREYLLSTSVCLLWGMATLPLGIRKVTAVVVVLMLFVIGFATLQAIPEWRMRLFDETVEAFAQRQDPRTLMLQTAPLVALESPFVGHGLGSYPLLMAQNLPISLATQDDIMRFYSLGLASHNSLLTAMVETGLFGFLGILLFFTGVGYWSLKVWRINRSSAGHPLALFAPLFAIQLAFGTMFQDGLVNNTIWAFFGMLVAIIALERAKVAGAIPRHDTVTAPPQSRLGPGSLQRSHVRFPRNR